MEKQYDEHFDNWVEEENKKHITQTLDKQKLITWLTKEVSMTNFYKNTEMQAVTIALQTVLNEVNLGNFDLKA